jgi:tripartite-type tricarboxylate transporter receptor subunit TctC
MFAPAGTPEPILQRLHDVATQAFQSKGIADKLDVQGIVAREMTLAQLRDFVRNETDKFGKVVTAANIKIE